MEQTAAHEQHNPDLLRLMPPTAHCVVEVGCSSGALAREYRKVNPACRYIGVEVMAQYEALARRHCDDVWIGDIEQVGDAVMTQSLAGDCWVFGDTLEHLRDPWALLSRVRRQVPGHGSVVACIPNAQHWSVQARLNCGAFRYEASGLLDRTHLRWFTGMTIIEMFTQAGFRIDASIPRVGKEPEQAGIRDAIRLMAQSLGLDPAAAYRDSLPVQYVVRAVPVSGPSGT